MYFLVFYKNFSKFGYPIEMDLFSACSKQTVEAEFNLFSCGCGYCYEFIASFTLEELLNLLLNDDLFESLSSGRVCGHELLSPEFCSKED